MSDSPEVKLKDELAATTRHGLEVLPVAVTDAFERSIEDLRTSGAARGLKVGDDAPDFTLSNQTGDSVTLSEELAHGPVILTFYRGEWCPFCNLELRAYQQLLDRIHEAGARLLAVSPQTPDHSLSIQEKNGLGYHVLSDLHNKVAEKYQLTFRLAEDVQQVYQSIGIALDQFNDDDSWELPVPATYVIDPQGVIRFASVDPDYRTRAEPEDVVRFAERI
ncbi:peroxiredoxin-like family protein [Paenibacillus sp. XY044]|uniref:peroxiredoxin-like family protein n=1 Tax=Paenibacillus sp. XY044 TaxID=2026089 RepID=UPI000B99B4DE|nr:peroxiredoxin-like family protein [Paenibacillus sp. XY044]OZB96244.1 alkyl hydroperoxide reductase [Paenibacillus sp. XY044]